MQNAPNATDCLAFSPDGKRFVCRTSGPGGEGLRIMKLEEPSITVLTNEYDNFPEGRDLDRARSGPGAAVGDPEFVAGYSRPTAEGDS